MTISSVQEFIEASEKEADKMLDQPIRGTDHLADYRLIRELIEKLKGMDSSQSGAIFNVMMATKDLLSIYLDDNEIHTHSGDPKQVEVTHS